MKTKSFTRLLPLATALAAMLPATQAMADEDTAVEQIQPTIQQERIGPRGEFRERAEQPRYERRSERHRLRDPRALCRQDERRSFRDTAPAEQRRRWRSSGRQQTERPMRHDRGGRRGS